MASPRSQPSRLIYFLPLSGLVTVLWLVFAPTPAPAAISFVAASKAENGTGATSLSITKPTGAAEGQVLVAAVTVAGTGTVTAPSGWTAIGSLTQGSTIQLTYYKVAGTSEPSSYSWSFGSKRAASGGIAAYSGVNQTVPIDATATAAGASGNASAPSATTSASGDLVLAVASFGAVATVTPDASTVERFEVTSGSNTSELADFTQASAGATSAKTITPSVSSGVWLAETIALRDTSQATLSVSTSAAPSFTANLNGGDQAQTFTVPLTLNDTRTGASAGLGWNTTITSTQFTTGSKTLPTTASTITAVTSSCANGGLCTNPTNSTSYPVAVPAGSTPPTAVKFASAAGGDRQRALHADADGQRLHPSKQLCGGLLEHLDDRRRERSLNFSQRGCTGH